MNQIRGSISMADTELRFNIDENNYINWTALDMLTLQTISGQIEPDESNNFWLALMIALSGVDDALTEEEYASIEELLGFVGENKQHPARWIP
jgi:hypothetical protein